MSTDVYVVDAQGYVQQQQQQQQAPYTEDGMMDVDVEDACLKSDNQQDSFSRSSSSSQRSGGYRTPRSPMTSSSEEGGRSPSLNIDASETGHEASNEYSGGDYSSGNNSPGDEANDSGDSSSGGGNKGGDESSLGASSRGSSPEAHLTEQLLSALDYFERNQNQSENKQRVRRAAREHRRTGKIVTQIDALAHMLEVAGPDVSPIPTPAQLCANNSSGGSSDASVLTAVAEYIRLMEDRNARLQSEHSAIVAKMDAMSSTDVVAEQQQHYPAPSQAVSSSSDESSCVSEADAERYVFGTNAAHLLRPSRSPDYKLLFLHLPVPMAVCNLEGKFSVANDRFTDALGLTHKELEERSLFSLATNDPQHLRAVVERLTKSDEAIPAQEVEGAVPNSTLLISFIRPASFTICLSNPNMEDLTHHAVVVG